MSISDKTFTILVDMIVGSVPATANSRKSFELYRVALQKQSDGIYSESFNLYYQALQLEIDPFARSYILYNLGLIYVKLGQIKKALIYFNQSLCLNPLNSSTLNNIAVLQHKIAEIMFLKSEFELSEIFFQKAAFYWKEALNLAPNQYPEAFNWLNSFKRQM